METAWLTDDIASIDDVVRRVGGLTRLYFGHETCPWRFPSEAAVEEARRKAAGEGLAFTLVTPPVHQNHLDGFLQRLARFRPVRGDEIVFNDLGLLRAASRAETTAARVMGRLLFPLPNDPCMTTAGLEATDLLPVASDPAVPQALLALGIARRDIDSPWGALAAPPETPIPFSLHRPWGILTVTRLCPFARTEAGWANSRSCAGACRGHHLLLSGEDEPGREAVMAGNAWYARLPEPAGPLPSCVDRLVLQDEVLLG